MYILLITATIIFSYDEDINVELFHTAENAMQYANDLAGKTLNWDVRGEAAFASDRASDRYGDMSYTYSVIHREVQM